MALANEQPQRTIFGQPLRSLQSTLMDAAKKHGAPRQDRYRGAGNALYFGDHDEVVIVFGEGRNVYLFEHGQREGIYNVHEVISIMRLYGDHYTLNNVRPVDAVAWFAEQHAPKPLKRETMRQYERRFSTSTRWQAALIEEQQHAARNEQHRELWQEYNDNRALMRGMG